MQGFLLNENNMKINLASMNRIKYFFTSGILLLSLVILFTQCPIKIVESRKSQEDGILKHLLNFPLYESEAKVMMMEITAYCSGPCCNTEIVADGNGRLAYIDWSNKIAASHAKMDELSRAGIDIVAVDTRVIPFGSIIRYNDHFYAALDRGGMIKGNKMDVALSNHEAANHFGRRKDQLIEVFVPSDSEEAIRVLTGISVEAGK